MGEKKVREEIEEKCVELCEGCIECRWQQMNGGTCKGGKERCGQFVRERA